MKLQKFAIELERPLAELIQAAGKAGIVEPKGSTELSDEQVNQIKAVLDGGQSAQPIGGVAPYQAIVLGLLDEVGKEMIAGAALKPQVQEMLAKAVAEYQANHTLPPNPDVARWVSAIASAQFTRSPQSDVIDVEAFSLPRLDLAGWANDPTSSQLLLAEELPVLSLGASDQ